MTRKTVGMQRKLWMYFGLFAIIIVVILWLMQILLLNSFYETMKVGEISRTGRRIVREYNQDKDRLADIVLEAHFNYGLSVGVYSANGTPVFGADVVFYPSSPNSSQLFPEIVEKLSRTPLNNISFVTTDSSNRYSFAIFAAKLETESGVPLYMCLTSPLSPTNSTTQVLKVQLLIVTAISLLIAFILSYFIARKLSAPIAKITKNASSFANGNYDVRFSHGGYTEINQLADVLNHTATELEKTDTLRRDLLANVSHDLRTPITIIRSYAEMIKDISGENPVKRNEHASVIMSESDHLSSLVTDILDLSKMESGIIKIDRKPFDICDTISNALNSFNVFAQKEGYTFNVNCTGSLIVSGDESRIRQVIYNLISNAINYTGDDKTVSIDAQISGNNIRVSISDTGKGIPPEEQALVWDRYYKSSSSHHRMHVGTGIGLSIVKNVLLMHKANFGIISDGKSGSTFWFELPKSQMEEL